MTDPVLRDDEAGEIELLLPFYANGRLSAAERLRVESALASDATLAARLELVREEMAETVLLNERLGAPSPRALDGLMAGMDAEPRRQPLLRRLTGGAVGWLGRQLAAQPPRRLAYAALAACALVLAQGVVLTKLGLSGDGAGRYETASSPNAASDGSYALMNFAADARAADVAAFFKRFEASVVDGPRANGSYKVRIGPAGLSAAAVDAILARMRSERGIVAFVAPAS